MSTIASPIIVCPSCATSNRVPRDKLAQGGKCGKCSSPLFMGKPLVLTGANFDTGIANIGFPSVTYTIGYSAGIVNGAGFDLGVVVARYTEDPFEIALSADGVVFTAPRRIEFESAFDTGIHQRYYYGGGGPFDAELFVHEIDLDDYGFAPGTVIHAVSIKGLEQLDLIRVAGVTAAVPEPGTWALMLTGGAVLGSLARRRRN